MNTRQKWNNLLQYSTALAAFLVISLSGVVLIVVVGIAALMHKISVFIK